MKKHSWIFDGCSPHNGEYWYKCTLCGEKDWIASYGTMSQLNNDECKSAIDSTVKFEQYAKGDL